VRGLWRRTVQGESNLARRDLIMGSFDAIQFSNLEFALLILVLALSAALVLSRRASVQKPEKVSQAVSFEGLMEWVKESESVCESLSKNIQEKRKIAKRLIAQLDRKIDEMNQALNKLNEKEPLPSDAGKNKDLQPAIIEMSNSGCDASQIARWLKIPEGQVQLVLDLRKFGDGPDRKPQPGISPVRMSRSDIRYSDSGFSLTDTP
jgi:hypothetical protein